MKKVQGGEGFLHLLGKDSSSLEVPRSEWRRDVTDEQVRRINEIVDDLLKIPAADRQPSEYPPFNLGAPIQGQSKADFDEQLRSMTLIKDSCTAILKELAVADADEEKAPKLSALRRKLDDTALEFQSKKEAPTAISTLKSAILHVGLSDSIVSVLRTLKEVSLLRVYELEEEGALYWKGKGRPPNHFARAIALRLARHYSERTGKKATYGTASYGPQHSTPYARALGDVFKVLEIKSDVSSPAEWVADNLYDSDGNLTLSTDEHRRKRSGGRGARRPPKLNDALDKYEG